MKKPDRRVLIEARILSRVPITRVQVECTRLNSGQTLSRQVFSGPTCIQVEVPAYIKKAKSLIGHNDGIPIVRIV